MNRILYSQHENPAKDDYFVIDGEVELENVSNKSLQAFEIVNSINNWEIVYDKPLMQIYHRENSIGIKSHYENVDEAGRKLFFVFYCKTEDLESALDLLKLDSELINREFSLIAPNLNLEKSTIKKKNKIILIIIVVIIILLIWNYQK